MTGWHGWRAVLVVLTLSSAWNLDLRPFAVADVRPITLADVRPITLADVRPITLADVRPTHGGSAHAVTSDYLTSITGVEPEVDGLRASVADARGSLEISWTGSGTLVVAGYQGEPYLRIDESGVFRNIHSPATYLNQTRYGDVQLPPEADATVAPEWQRISSGHSTTWHDHRAHWMAPVLPAQVQEDPDRAHLLQEWQVPLTIDGRAVVIDGRLDWIPPPSATGWTVAAVAGAILLCLGLFSRWWRRVAVGVAALGTIVVAVDGVGYLLASSNVGTRELAWTIGWPLLAAAATVWLARVLRGRDAHPPVAMAVTGLIIAVVGGIDRFDSLTNSQVFTSFPDWTARAAVVASLAIGAALLARLFADLIPMLATGKRRPDHAH